MKPFAFVRAPSGPAALSAMASNSRASFVAGGTSVLDLMKIAVEEPDVLVDINALPLRSIERRGDVLLIGALARMSDVASDAGVRELFPMLASALEQSASPQLRNMASIGGNLMQRTRCPYFRDVATPCNKRSPGSGCGAIGGVNRSEAVLGTSSACIATHPSDLAVALRALDAVVHVTGSKGDRDIAFAEFYCLPSETPHVETTLARGELVSGLSVPLPAAGVRSAYVKARDRAECEFASASAAVELDMAGQTIRSARIALGGVATVPWRSPQAESALAGAAASCDAYERAARAAFAAARGFGGNDFKIELGRRTLVRALEMAAST